MFTYHLANSVGVIGGADGPTAIFVSTAPQTTTVIVVICLVAGLAVGLIVGIIYKRIKKKKDDSDL